MESTDRPATVTAEDDSAVQRIDAELVASTPSPRRRAVEAVVIAALGSVPWVGGFAAAGSSLAQQKDSIYRDNLLREWMTSLEDRLASLRQTLDHLVAAYERLGPSIDSRLESREYLSLVKRAFRTWERSDTDEKRDYIAKLLANAAGTALTTDDVVRQFIDWLDEYDETHFAVIRTIFKVPGSTRSQVWHSLSRGTTPRDDSPEADLFRKLIDDLSRGRVIRQHRDVTDDGRFVRAKPEARARNVTPVLLSAFEDGKQYELTNLGKQFVSYTMNEIVPRIA